MAKLTLNPVANISGAESTAIGTLNTNFDAIETALENTLSRDGTSPNQLNADLDLNNNDILNVDNIYASTLVLDGVIVIPTEVTEVVPISAGGTGATTEADARDNLELYSITETLAAIKQSYASVSAFRLSTVAPVNTEVTLFGYYTVFEFPSGGGEFYYDASDTVSADNGVSVFVNAVGSRIKRRLAGPATPQMGGVVAGTVADQSANFQAVLNVYKHVQVPAGDYWITPIARLAISDSTEVCGITLNNYQTLEITDGANLKALPVATGAYAVVAVYFKSNARIIGGGRITGERGGHLGATGEQGFGIDVRGSTKVTVGGVTVSDCWGDGLYVGKIAGGAGASATNTKFKAHGADFTNNRRNNISIVHAQRPLIEGCSLELANGTDPQCGIDVEPNVGGSVTDFIVANCNFKGNYRSGIRVEGMSVRVRGGTITGNTFTGDASVAIVTRDAGITVRMSDCITVTGNQVTDSKAHGIFFELSTNCVATGNLVDGCQYHGVRILDCDNASVEGNHVHQPSNVTSNAYSAYTIEGAGAGSLGNRVAHNRSSGTNTRHVVFVTNATDNEVIEGNSGPWITKAYSCAGTLRGAKFFNNDNATTAVAAPGNVTPDVVGVDYLDLSAQTNTPITRFVGGYLGQRLKVRLNAGLTVTQNASVMQLAGSVNWVSAGVNDCRDFICIIPESSGTFAKWLQVT